jgi:hypothetical protein
MDSEDKEIELAPKGMFPADDDEDIYEIDIDENLDVWNRGTGYTWGGGQSWWQTTSMGSSVSSMWSMGGTGYVANDDAARMLKNKRHIDSLCKVVDPTVAHTLEFAAEHTSGHTDMNRGHIVVDGSLIRLNDNKLDILAGLAIHEKLHVIHSYPLMTWQRNIRAEVCKSEGERDLFQSISNIVEDEYIERQLHKTSAGYVHYIEACKEHYFGEAKHDIDTDTSQFGDLINTFMMLVRYPSKIDTDRRKRHAPHIRLFMSMIKDGIDNREAVYKCILLVHKYLLAQASKMDDQKDISEIMEELKDKAMDYGERRVTDSFGEENDDLTSEMRKSMIESIAKGRFDELKERYESSSDRSVDKLWKDHKGIDSVLHDEMNDISKSIHKKMKELEDTDFYSTDIGKLALNDGQKEITWQKAIQETHHVDRYKNDKKAMHREISKLSKKVQLFGNIQKHNIYNQKRGILNKRQLHKIPMGMTDLFKATIVNQDKPLDVCVLVDESGSMGHYTMRQARQGAIAIKEALSHSDMINLWVYGHSADETGNGKTEMVEYSSPTMKDRPMAMGGMRARYENRDGNAIVASCQRIKGESDNTGHKLMIVLSDGQPSASGYRGPDAYEHTKKSVKYAETQGWSIIQVGFEGASKPLMDRMFPNWTYVEDSSKLGDEVSKIIRKVIKI